MNRTLIALAAFGLFAVFACDSPTAVTDDLPSPSFGLHGATVHNPGVGQPSGSCFFGPFTATQHSAVRTPNGRAVLSCKFTGLPPIPRAVKLEGFTCFLSLDGLSFTNKTRFVRSASGQGHMTCIFDD